MINWRRKLGSRKFWALLAALVVSGMALCGADAGSSEKVAALVTAAGACVAYILAEASVDRACGGWWTPGPDRDDGEEEL